VTKSGYRIITANIKQAGDEKDPIISDQVYNFKIKKSGQGFGIRADMIKDYSNPANECDDPSYFFRAATTPALILGETAILEVLGGVGPYTWEIETPVWNWTLGEEETTGTTNTIDVCVITPLEWDYVNSDETIVQSSTAVVYITGGIGPFEWEVTGTGFTMEEAVTAIYVRTNTLIADAGACGTATIVVTDTAPLCAGSEASLLITDACDEELSINLRACGSDPGGGGGGGPSFGATGYVRCTAGQWVKISENSEAARTLGSELEEGTVSHTHISWQVEYTNIIGKSKYIEVIEVSSLGVDCPPGDPSPYDRCDEGTVLWRLPPFVLSSTSCNHIAEMFSGIIPCCVDPNGHCHYTELVFNFYWEWEC